MAESEASIICEIQDKYVPFLKKLIAFLEKTKKATPDNLNRLKSIHSVFTTAAATEQVQVFRANKKKLEKWFKNSQKEKMSDEGAHGSKRSMSGQDSDSSQGGIETLTKKSKTSEPVPSLNFDPAIIAQIKKEKSDSIPKVLLPTVAPKIVQVPQPSSFDHSSPAQPAETPVNENNNGQVNFSCASCQFQTQDEQEFMKHTRTDHRSDLSMWCKQCGKCFSNAGVLVSHIKERACSKEEMIYRCGVKDCTFETTSGQTFVHHLRHCHKGSPFIFCVHCQKIFTLPHCLILHMQDDCPDKAKNRRNPGSVPPPTTTVPNPSAVPERPQTISFSPRTPTIASVTSAAPRPIALAPVRSALTPIIASPSPRARGMILRGRIRGRGRGRGRGRPPSESSDSDDPDDPSWKPEEVADQTTLRRSGRWAKKISDVVNVETSKPTKGVSMADMHAKEMLKCPCCDFLAAFDSVLQDHYIANHKVPNKNACLVCHLKFESTRGFLDHFADHASGKLTDRMTVTESAPEKPQVIESPVDTSESSPAVDMIAAENEKKQTGEMISFDKETMKGVVKNISEAVVVDPTSDQTQYVKIPYQAAIHDKGLKDSKLKKFEELKSPSDVIVMRSTDKLKCFYKCSLLNCCFATNDNDKYSSHLDSLHKGKRMNCCYCLKEFFAAETLTQHMVVEHSKRQYQCSNCFYRAYSMIHLQIHVKNYHAKDTNTEIFACDPIAIPCNVTVAHEFDVNLNTTWPFICAIGDCSFQSFDPKEFKCHNETVHRSVSVFFCHYCKVDFISFKRLLNHYRLHGINTFQCNYCIHGSETKDEILLHLCNVHADQPLRAYMRGSEEDVSLQATLLPFSRSSEVAKANKLNNIDSIRSDSPPVEINEFIDFENLLYEVVGETYYPKYLRNMCSDLTCGVPCCLEKFESVLAYIGHLRNAHLAVNFSCPHCPQVSENWEDFRNHLMCHGSELYACGLLTCDFYDWDKNVVTEHLKTHSHSSAKVVIVREPPSESEEVNEITMIKSLPQTFPFKIGEEFFQCFFCRYKSSDMNVMKNHMYSEILYRRFGCSYCSEKCVSRKEIKEHSVKHHPGFDVKCSVDLQPEIESLVKKLLHQKINPPDLKSVQCSICKKNFKSAIQWQRHLCLCTRSYYQPYDCDHCGVSVPDLKILKFHVDEKHFPKPMTFSETSSSLIEEEVGKKLQSLRLMHMNEVLTKDKPLNDTNQKLSFLKIYLCSVCNYESNQKYNTQNHIKNTHHGIPAEVSKILRNVRFPDVANSDENSNDNSKMANESAGSKRFRCGFCIKKLYTFQELEKHVEGTHPVKNESEYFYYYSPDPKVKFMPDDKEMYECAYCKSGKENLDALKKHSDLMHSESQFKVKGFVVRNQGSSLILACGYCYHRVESKSELKRHIANQHPSLPHKSIGGFRGGYKRVAVEEEPNDLPNKRVKFASLVFVCAHCGAAYSSQNEITTHSRKSHTRLKLEFIKKSPVDDIKFYKCEFCNFTSETDYLETHLMTKHKMRVTCSYCKKRFEFATKLREHHDIVHKGLPIKYSQETIGMVNIKKERKDSVTMDGSQPSVNATKSFKAKSKKSLTKYRKESESIDMSQIFVEANEGGSSRRISVLNYSKKCDIFPEVVLTDVLKKNK